jgi:hypothetical protein
MTGRFERSVAGAALDSLNLGPLNLELATRWLDLWQVGRLPSRSALDPTQLVKFLPGLAILEIHPSDTVRFRIAGRSLTAAFGFDPSRRDLLALTPAGQRAARLARFKAFVAGTVGSTVRLVKRRGEADVVAQDLVLPLGGHSETGARAWIFHTSWRPARSETLIPLPAGAVGMADDYLLRPLG